MSDDQIAGEVALELSRQVFHVDNSRKAAWRRLPQSGSNLWVLADSVQRLREPTNDLIAIQQAIRLGADLPEFSEVFTACHEVGLKPAAILMSDVITAFEGVSDPAQADRAALEKARVAWLAAISTPAAKASLAAYTRQHLSACVGP